MSEFTGLNENRNIGENWKKWVKLDLKQTPSYSNSLKDALIVC